MGSWCSVQAAGLFYSWWRLRLLRLLHELEVIRRPQRRSHGRERGAEGVRSHLPSPSPRYELGVMLVGRKHNG